MDFAVPRNCKQPSKNLDVKGVLKGSKSGRLFGLNLIILVVVQGQEEAPSIRGANLEGFE